MTNKKWRNKNCSQILENITEVVEKFEYPRYEDKVVRHIVFRYRLLVKCGYNPLVAVKTIALDSAYTSDDIINILINTSK